MALFAQDIGKRAKMRDVENLAQRMARTQRNLLDALTDLDKLGKEMDAAAREALERELNELERAMQALMEALSKLPSQLPDEFLNSEALHNLELKRHDAGRSSNCASNCSRETRRTPNGWPKTCCAR